MNEHVRWAEMSMARMYNSNVGVDERCWRWGLWRMVPPRTGEPWVFLEA